MEYEFPAPPPQAALDFLNSKELTPSFSHEDVWREEHGYAFAVAKVAEVSLLDTIRDELARALDQGIPFEQFKRDLTPTLQKLGWWGRDQQVDPLTGDLVDVTLGTPRRLKTIYDVNLRQARAVGQWQRIQDTKDSHPYLLYELGPSEQHRPQHVGWAGILLPADDPFWTTHFAPNGYGCKCRIRQVSQREFERLNSTSNFQTTAPAIELREYINKRSGEALQVPVGIDPSFDINPGIARQTHIQNLIRTKLNGTDSQVAQTAIKQLLTAPPFADFVRKPSERFPVAVLSSDQRSLISVDRQVVLLEADAVLSADGFELSDYQLLPTIIQDGTLESNIVTHATQTRSYQVVLTTSTNDAEAIIESLNAQNR